MVYREPVAINDQPGEDEGEGAAEEQKEAIGFMPDLC
jgi:hypothetical protein